MWLRTALILCAVVCYTNVEAKDAHELRMTLFESYDKFVRPVKDHKTPTSVYIGMKPFAITDLDEVKQILEFDTFMYMRWKDEYLTWNPEEYGGITVLNIPSTELWSPDITIYNGSPAKNIIINVHTHAIVNYTGDVTWAPPVTVRSRCPQNNPVDQLDAVTCVVRVGSWTHHEYWIDIQDFTQKMETEDYFEDNNPKWHMATYSTERLSKYYACCKEPYPVLDFKLILKRKPNSKTSSKCTSPNHMMQHHCMPTYGCGHACGGNMFHG